MSDNAKKLWLVLLAGSAFGSSIVFARTALQEIGPYPVTVLRFGIASAAYLITLPLLKKKFFKDLKLIRDVSVVGVVGTGLPLLLFYFSLLYVSSGILAVLLATLPMFTALLAHFFIATERLTIRLLGGLLISLIGVIILIASKSNGLTEDFSITGPLIGLVGVLMAAVGAVYTKVKLSKQDPLVVSASQTVAAFIFVTVFVLAIGKWELGSISLGGWIAIFYNGMVGSYIAFWLTFILIKKFGATASSLVGYVMPVVSATLGAVMLDEVITLTFIFVACLILVGVYFASSKTELTKNQ